MKRMASIALGALLLSALAARDAAGQWNVARLDTDRNRVFVTSGMDPALVLSLGYARTLPVGGHDVQLITDVGLAGGRMDTHDFRARLGVHGSVAHWRSVHFTGSATFVTRGTENIIYRGLNFGSDFTGTLGVYRRHWFAGGELGFDKAIVTHVTHTEFYRKYFYADAKNGWYLNAGGNFHSGLTAGLAFGRTELVGRFGVLRTEDFNEVVPPMYASAGLGFRFYSASPARITGAFGARGGQPRPIIGSGGAARRLATASRSVAVAAAGATRAARNRAAGGPAPTPVAFAIMNRTSAALGSLLFLLVAPGFVVGLVPWWLCRWQIGAPLLGVLAARYAGILLLAAGTIGLLDSFVRFIAQFGTPAPIAPTRGLVVTGLYRYLRNPMYVSLVLAIAGQALLFGSLAVLRYAAIVWLLSHFFVLLYEEPTLAATFGKQYGVYAAHVPRWIPRLTPWTSGAGFGE